MLLGADKRVLSGEVLAVERPDHFVAQDFKHDLLGAFEIVSLEEMCVVDRPEANRGRARGQGDNPIRCSRTHKRGSGMGSIFVVTLCRFMTLLRVV